MSRGAEEMRYDMECEAHQNVLYHIAITPGYAGWTKIFGDQSFGQQYVIALSERNCTNPEEFSYVMNKDGDFGFSSDLNEYVIADSDILFIDSVMGRWGDTLIGMYAANHGKQPRDVQMHLVAVNFIPPELERAPEPEVQTNKTKSKKSVTKNKSVPQKGYEK